MATPELSNYAEQDPQVRRIKPSRSTLLVTIGMVVVLLGTNYTALTSDAFRHWATRHLPSVLTPERIPVQQKEDPRIAEGMAREVALAAQIRGLQGRIATLTIDVAGLKTANAKLIDRERQATSKFMLAEERRLAGVVAAQRLGNRMKVRVGKSFAR